MPIRLRHPINGYENVYSESAAQAHEKNGWIREEEIHGEIPENFPVLPIPQTSNESTNKKRGRKPKWQSQTTQN